MKKTKTTQKLTTLMFAVILLATLFPIVAIMANAEEIIVKEIASGLDYAIIGNFSEGLAYARKGSYSDGKYGYIDKIGKEVIPFEYDGARQFSEGVAVVKKDGKYGFIDKTGKEVVPFVYSEIGHYFTEGLAWVEKDGKYGYMDTTGTIIIHLIYDSAGFFAEGLAAVSKDGKYGYIDKTGETVISFEYESASDFSEGLAQVIKNGEYGMIDKNGKIVVPFSELPPPTPPPVWKPPTGSNFFGPISDGLQWFTDFENFKIGYRDETEKIVVPAIYDDAGDFHEGLAVVQKDGKYSILEIAKTSSLDSTDESSISNFEKKSDYASGMFADVDESQWYAKVIATAYEYGLMKGNSSNTFNPTGNITIAEAITVASRVHSIYMTGKDNFTAGNPWYQPYVDYAVKNGIIAAGDFTDYTRPATRAEMAYIFSRSLPASEFPAQNTVNALPDVNAGTKYYDAILTLYKAGVVGGNDAAGTFKPTANITRAEAAAIISRVVLPSTRQSGKTY